MTVCAPFPPGISLNNSDCDDTLDTVYPGASGTGEGIDNNCDNVIDGDELVPCTVMSMVMAQLQLRTSLSF